MMSRLTVDWLGARGEGVAQGPEGLIYVPYASVESLFTGGQTRQSRLFVSTPLSGTACSRVVRRNQSPN